MNKEEYNKKMALHDFLVQYVYDPFGITMSIAIVALILTGTVWGIIYIAKDIKKTGDYTYNVFHERQLLSYYGAKDDLVARVDSYIQVIAPGSLLNGLALVEKCSEYNVDLCFVMAQGQIESHYGTKGMAARTGSVFNVGAIDGADFSNIKNKYKYTHPDYSIEPYLDLLTNTYLIRGKTELDLMEHFVDTLGHRYASYSGYESMLSSTYDYISKDMGSTYDQYKRLRRLAGIRND